MARCASGVGGVRRTEHGAVAVEFALVLVPFLVLVFGLIQYGIYFYASQVGSNTAHTAARQLSVGNCQNSTDLNDFVNGLLTGAESGTATVTTSYRNIDGSTPNSPQAANVEIGGTVTLTITFSTLDFHFPFLSFMSNADVTRTVEARVEDVIDDGCGT